jgi:hypothetical protein
MKKVIFITLLLLFTLVSYSPANPMLLGEPAEDTDYYYINIDEYDTYVAPATNYLFAYDIYDLADGVHKVGITTWHEKWGEGACVIFNLKVRSNKNWKWFTIEKIPTPDDPYYDDRFLEPFEIKVKRPLSKTLSIPEGEGESSSGGCFINNLIC